MQYIFGCKKYIFKNGGSKMDKDTNVFGPVILEGDTPELGYDFPVNPRPSEDSGMQSD